jgi:hypothetical protein
VTQQSRHSDVTQQSRHCDVYASAFAKLSKGSAHTNKQTNQQTNKDTNPLPPQLFTQTENINHGTRFIDAIKHYTHKTQLHELQRPPKITLNYYSWNLISQTGIKYQGIKASRHVYWYWGGGLARLSIVTATRWRSVGEAFYCYCHTVALSWRGFQLLLPHGGVQLARLSIVTATRC